MLGGVLIAIICNQTGIFRESKSDSHFYNLVARTVMYVVVLLSLGFGRQSPLLSGLTTELRKT